MKSPRSEFASRGPLKMNFSGCVLLLLATLVVVSSPAQAASRGGGCVGGVAFVDRDAAGADDGSSWSDAFNDLQDALAIDSPCEIWIAEGVYVPSSDPNNRGATFQLRNGIELYGGFDGTENTREARDWRFNPTVLSGDIGADDQTLPNGVVINPDGITGNNSVHVVTGSGTDATARLDGVIVTAGNANGTFGSATSCTDACGGGMIIAAGAPTLANVSFIGNRASGTGGGLFQRTGSSPVLTNTRFSGNSAGRDGGGLANIDSAPTLVNPVFSGNSAGQRGGGLWVNRVLVSPDDGRPTLINATFSANVAGDTGGGIYSASDSGPDLLNTIIWNNQDASGIGTSSSSIDTIASSPMIRYSLVQGQNPPGEGNLDGADPNNGPLFTLNLRLGPGSAPIDAGDPNTDLTVFPGGPGQPVDIDGNPRVFPGGSPDLGASEFVGLLVFADNFESETCARGSACNDGSPCTFNDTCQADGSCRGTPADGIPCQDDGLFCTLEQQCFFGACASDASGSSPCDSFDSEGDCESATCNELFDTCLFDPLPDNEACDDGDECTLVDLCKGGICEGFEPDPTCDFVSGRSHGQVQPRQDRLDTALHDIFEAAHRPRKQRTGCLLTIDGKCLLGHR